jgi:hypothetical protein
MAQWNIQTQDYLNQERSLFEVFLQADRQGKIFEPLGQGFSGDLFGRLKVSNPLTLFDSSHIYYQDGDFDDVIVGTGSTVGFITAQSSATLGIGTTAGCSYIRQSKRVFSYQPGKSLQVFQTFVLNPPKENLTQRVGYGSSLNGIFLEQVGSQVNIVKRTSVSGVSTTITIPQSQWNKDTLDGTGFSTSNPSGIQLDLTKAQLMFTEYEWLGVGDVRVGFQIDSKMIIAHQFQHTNEIDSVYMRTATLPLRYEILNTGITTSPSTMKQICASVVTNGGYERKKTGSIARMTTSKNVGNTFEPLVSIRIAPGREFAVVLPFEFGALPLANNVGYEIALIRNGTLTGASFAPTPDSVTENVQYDITASAITGGKIVNTSYTFGANQSSGSLSVQQDYNWSLQLGTTQAGVSDIYTVAARTISGTGGIIGFLGYYDLT